MTIINIDETIKINKEYFNIRKDSAKDKKLADPRVDELREIIKAQNQKMYALERSVIHFKRRLNEELELKKKSSEKGRDTSRTLESIYFCAMCRCLEENNIFKLKGILEEAINKKL